MASPKPIIMRPYAFSSLSSDNARAGYGAVNAGRFKAAGVVYRSDGSTNVNLKGHFGAGGLPIDFVALLSCNATSSTTARFKLGSSAANAASGVSYDSGAQVIRSPAPAVERADGLSHWFWELPSAVSGSGANYCQLDIGSHTGDFEASMLVVGKKVQADRSYNLDYGFGADDLGGADLSNWGVVEDTGGVVRRSLDFALAWESEAKFETEFRPLIETVGQREPVYVCLDPQATSYRQARTYFGLLKRPLFARGSRRPGTFLQEYSIISLV